MLSQKELKKRLSYEYATGVFTRVKSLGGKLSGTISGCVDSSNGYVKIGVCGRKFYAHRLAWLYFYGYFPKKEIDHIDGNKLNNSISNLRCVDHKENSKNTPLRVTNKSGFTGVSFSPLFGKWRAYINVDGKHKGLGLYTNLSDAVKVRIDSEVKYEYHDNHGRRNYRRV